MQTFDETRLFYMISKALYEQLDLKKSLYNVLDILAETLGMERGTVNILNPLRNEIKIEVAHEIGRAHV